MASDPFSGAGRAFDALLNKNRGWFDEQLQAPLGPRPAASTSVKRVQPEPRRPARIASPAPHPAGPVIETSEPVRLLNERFGNAWSYQVASRERNGDEVAVLCNLTLPNQAAARPQTGRARVLQPGQPRLLKGTMDDLEFAMVLDQGVPAGQDAEEAAFRRAVIEALSKCVETL